MTTTLTLPDRVQLRRVRGWRLPDDAVIVSRNTGFGNPFRIFNIVEHGQAATDEQARAVAVRLHRDWLAGYGPARITVGRRTFDRGWVLANVGRLRGRALACSCPPVGPCHATTLLQLANGGAP